MQIFWKNTYDLTDFDRMDSSRKEELLRVCEEALAKASERDMCILAGYTFTTAFCEPIMAKGFTAYEVQSGLTEILGARTRAKDIFGRVTQPD